MTNTELIANESIPNEVPEFKKECWIYGTIIYFSPIKSENCTITYETIIRDDNYTYYKITSQENKSSYIDWMYTPTTSKEISCEWKYSDSWTSFIHKIWDKYYFTIRKYYDWNNYSIKNSKEKNDSWNKLDKCTWNIIDQAPSKNIENNYNFYYYITWWIIILILVIFIFFKKMKKPKKSA